MCKTLNFLYLFSVIFLSIISIMKIKYSNITCLLLISSLIIFIIGNFYLLRRKDSIFNVRSNYVYVSPCGKPRVISWNDPLAQAII